MKCDKCGYDCQGTGDFAHVCSARNGGVLLQDLIAEMEQTTEGKVAMEEGRKWVRETIAAQAAVIEKLRRVIAVVEHDSEEVMDFDECTAMMIPMDTYHALIEALPIPDDSAQVLKEWLDEVLGEPVAWLCVNEDGECEQIDYGSESPLPGDEGFEPLFRKPEVK